VHVVTTDPTAAFCPACGVVSSSVRQRRTTSPRDVPYSEERLAVRWHKVQYACRERQCPRKAFTEQIAELPAGARITHRLRRQVGAAVGDGQAVSVAGAGLNALARVSKGHAELVAATIRTIFAQPGQAEVRAQVDKFADMLTEQFPTVAELLRDAKPELTAFSDFPRAH